MTLREKVLKLIENEITEENIGNESYEIYFKFAFRDVLTEMMHIAKEKNLDFEDRLNIAKEVFEEEIEAENDPTP